MYSPAMAPSNSAAAAGSEPSAGSPKTAPSEKMKPSRVALYALNAPALQGGLSRGLIDWLHGQYWLTACQQLNVFACRSRVSD